MDKKKKKLIFGIIVTIAIIILFGVGSTFAYFTATISSEEGAVSMEAAVFTLDLKDDISLIKGNIIPSAEKYVDLATRYRLDANGDFIKPYEENGEEIVKGTTCIDDNLNEICSVYTFTVQNPMTDMELPIYVTLHPSLNTFKNLHFKVLDKDKNVVMEATPITGDDLDQDGNIDPVALTGLVEKLGKATDENTPSEATYSIVLFLMETYEDQTLDDGGQVFGAALHVSAISAEGQGITGVFSAGGTE